MESLTILSDADVKRLADMGELVALLMDYFRARPEGRMVAPPRHAVEFGDRGRLVFTIGGVAGREGFAGFRVYDTFGPEGEAQAQLTAIWNLDRSALDGILLGPSLGEFRTGAIGGVAIDAMAKADATQCGIIGSGPQAETQLMAAAAVRPALKQVLVFSRSVENRENFARRMSRSILRPVSSVSTAREATVGSEILICATNSPTPVIDCDWLSPGVHINTVGSRLQDAHELPVELGERTTRAATDSLAQIRALPRPHFLRGTPAGEKMIELSDVLATPFVARGPADITLFCSVGVAGSEVAVGAALLRKHRTLFSRSSDASVTKSKFN
jgi:alanine dehydrogenase